MFEFNSTQVTQTVHDQIITDDGDSPMIYTPMATKWILKNTH